MRARARRFADGRFADRRFVDRIRRARPTRALLGALGGWGEDRCASMAAALAFYAAFSMAPMLVNSVIQNPMPL